MKIYLLRDARIRHNAGEVVEASPDEAGYLVSVGSAVIMEAAVVPSVPARVTPEDAKRAETPEKSTAKKKK